MTELTTLPRPEAGLPVRAKDARAVKDAVQRLSSGSARVGAAGLQARYLFVQVLRLEFSAPNTLGLTCVYPSTLVPEIAVQVPYTFNPTTRDSVNYTYTSINARVADGTENQAMTPSYIIGDLIAIFFDGLGWRDANIDGRQWAKVP